MDTIAANNSANLFERKHAFRDVNSETRCIPVWLWDSTPLQDKLVVPGIVNCKCSFWVIRKPLQALESFPQTHTLTTILVLYVVTVFQPHRAQKSKWANADCEIQIIKC